MGRRPISGGGAAALTLALLALLLLAPIAGIASAGASLPLVTSEKLIENADRYDQKTVTYQGEVVGDILGRGDHAWITVNDDHYSKRAMKKYAELKGGNTGIGVYCRRDQLEQVRFLGSYRTAGDFIEVTGTFYRANQEFGGDLCIVADRVMILREGHSMDDNRFGAMPFVALALIVLSAWIGFILLRRRGAVDG